MSPGVQAPPADLIAVPEVVRSIAAEVRPFTYLGPDRLYTLWQAIAGMPAQADAVVEIGAYYGGSARFIAESLRAQHREVPFVVCDTFRGHVDVDAAIDGRHAVGQQFTDVRAENTKAYLEDFANVQVVEGDIRETSARLDRHQFGVVHLDVDVYPITKYCLEVFGPRVVTGGTIVVDDYGSASCRGVQRAVDEFLAAHPRFRLLHLLNGPGQAVLIPVAA